MKKIIIASIAACLLISSPAIAGSKLDKLTKNLEYGAGIGMVDMGLSDSGMLFYGTIEKPLKIRGLEKEGFNSVAQLRLGTSTAASTGPVEASIDYLISGMFKSSMEIEKAVTAYAMLGFSYASVTTSTPVTTIPAIVFGGVVVVPAQSFGGDVSSTDSSISWGIGADYEVDRDLTVGVEYAAYWSDITAIAVNAKFNF